MNRSIIQAWEKKKKKKKKKRLKASLKLVRDRGLVPIAKNRTIARRVEGCEPRQTDGQVQEQKLINTAHQESAIPFSSDQHTVHSPA
jgi:hypothetical protein